MFGMLFLVGGALVATYFYFFFTRAFRVFGVEGKLWLRIALAVLFGVCGAQITSVLSVIVLHFAALSVLFDLLYLLLRVCLRDRALAIWAKVHATGVLACMLAGVLLLGGYWNMYHVTETRYTVDTAKPLSRSYRFALIADLHFGVSIDEDGLRGLCEDIGAQNVDMVLLCGDIVDESTTEDEVRTAFDALGSIPATYGVFFVYGNHDRMGNERDGGALAQVIEQSGIRILADEVYRCNEELVVVGRKDKSASRRGEGRAPLADLLVGQLEADDFVLSLDHQPNAYDEQAEWVDLVLSGHTHGGQFFPLGTVQEIFAMNDMVYGMEALDADTTAIVTAGVAGWRYPIKTAAPAEYVVIEVK